MRCVAVAALVFGVLVTACTGEAPVCEDPECMPDAGQEPALDAGHDATVDAGEDAPSCAADTDVDPANCGACDDPCAPGQTCSAGVCVCGPVAAVAFSDEIQPIFAPCATGMCHSNNNGVFGLKLGVGQSYEALVGVPANQCRDGRLRVAPGEPSRSYLIDKLMGVRLCSGSEMPPSTALPDGDIEKIAAWICAGAPNN